MTDTVKEIRHVASQVNAGAGQISATANDLAEGATEQAGAVEELTAAVEKGMLSGQTEIKTFTILRGLVSLYTNEKDLTKCGKWLTVYLKNGGDAADLFSPFARAIENAVSKNDKTA